MSHDLSVPEWGIRIAQQGAKSRSEPSTPPPNATSASHEATAAQVPESEASWLGLNLEWLYRDFLQSLVHKTQCPHQARDTLHDALIRYATVALRQPIQQPRAYIRRVAESVMVDRHRSARRLVLLDDLPPEEADAIVASQAVAPSAETMADLRQRLQHLQKIIERLPPRCREVFWLLRVEGYTQPEIAERMGISLKTVEGHVARALVLLSEWRETYSCQHP